MSFAITKRLVMLGALGAGASLAFGCDESSSKKEEKEETPATITTGTELKVPVPDGSRVYVKLGPEPAVVTPADPKTDKGWDIAFEGLDVFTNSGATASGGALAFGPLDQIVFLDDVAPSTPFLTEDKTGGAFLRWYFYEGAPTHVLHSRYHVYAIKDGDKTYKVQVLSYYGEREGAPLSALYSLRWAEVTTSGSGPTQELTDLDGTAGGSQGGDDAPSDCLDLGTGARSKLAPAAARTSTAWHICVRRQDISVNGEIGGPRNVGAADLNADKTATETLDSVASLTPESEKASFDAVNQASFAGHELRGDRIVSAFSGLWLERGASPPAPAKRAWLVQGADGKSKYLVGFTGFEGATPTGPGTVVMRVKAVK